nr:RNA-directed DNA polymerase, eukaryota, reverse transcriptase zinc-binding domain protein [Tanacetum cinerariifolium]
MEANHLDKDDTSLEDKENDDLDDIDGILKDLDNDAKNEENVFVSPKVVVPDQLIKQVEEDILKQPEEECIKVSESSDLSRPPGFKNTKKTLSNNSKCSTNFARHHTKDIKGISLIHELNKIIEVGTTLGYDVRGCKKSLNRMINGIVQESKMTRLELFRLKSLWGNINFDYAYSMARGRSGGLIFIWDPNFFSKEAIWCDDNFIIVKGHWNNEVRDCFMINIYGPQESAAKSSLWNRLAEFMNQHNGKFILLVISTRSFTNTKGVMEDIPDIKVKAIERLLSDHSPILLHSKKADFGPSPFKLYNSWLSRDGFDDIVKSTWDSMETRNGSNKISSHVKLRNLKNAIKKWQVDVRKNDRSQKSANLSEIHDTEKKIDDGSTSISDREKRIKLLQDIDKNENLEALDLIQKARIKWDIEGDKNFKFFHRIINSKRRTQAIADFLEFHISLDEVKNAVWECSSNKAPGPDVLCPKIISKLFANWLSKVIDKVVSKEQSAFISGRQILDGPLIISEIIQWYKKRKKKMLTFKVDFEKAFDSISWKYLDFILDSLGFGSKWRSWIRACLHSSRASILINGSLTFDFSVKRGLRQGDPLSPFLFILVMEGLHYAMSNAVNSGLIRGIKLSSSGIVLSHLIYADDVIITTDWNPHDIDNIIRVLHDWLCWWLFSFHISWLPIDANINLTFSWQILIDCFQKRLSSWKANLLSIAFTLDSFGVVLKILGIWRRLLSSPNNMWVNIIKALHGQEGGLNNQGCSFNSTWSRIIGTSNFLHSKGIIPLTSFCFKVGCGTHVRFWKDIWIGDSPLHTRYDIGTRNTTYLIDLLLEISQIDISVDEDMCTW